MKEFLVLVSGSEKDAPVAATALEIARPLSAHLGFLHFRASLGEMAAHMPHYEFAIGSAIGPAMEELRQHQDTRAAKARYHVEELCRSAEILLTGQSQQPHGLSASFAEESGRGLATIVRRARYSDVVILGRRTAPNGMPDDLLEQILLESGRPVIIAPDQSPSHPMETIAIFWKESPEAARAVTAAMPLLALARRVVVLTAPEGKNALESASQALAQVLNRNGIGAEVQNVTAGSRSTSDALLSAARDCRADLIVTGGYGHSRALEFIFGGCTRTFIEGGDIAMFMVH